MLKNKGYITQPAKPRTGHCPPSQSKPQQVVACVTTLDLLIRSSIAAATLMTLTNEGNVPQHPPLCSGIARPLLSPPNGGGAE